MKRNPLFLTILALFVLIFAQVCLADADIAIKAARDKVILLIDAGNYSSAELAANKMAADFAGNEILPKRLWEVANRYDKVEAYDHSKKLCEQIAANYPKDVYATYAALQLAKLRIFEQIDAGSYGAAYSAVPQVIKDFAGHKQLARRLWEIANRYDNIEAFDYAKLLSGRIAADCPKDAYARYASLLLARLKAYDLIDTGDYEAADSAVSAMTNNFAGHKQLPKRLWEVANRYDKVEAYDYSKKLCERMATNYPKDIYAAYAALQLAKIRIFEQIDTGSYEAAYSAVPQVMKDFAGHKQLAKRLWEIANRFDKFKTYEYSKSLCQKIVTNYPKDEYASYAGLQLAKLEVYELIDANNYESVEKAISQMMSDYAKQRQLPRRLYEIAHQYEKKGDAANATALHSRIAGSWPNDEYGVRAFFKCKIANNNFDETKIAELRNEIDNFVNKNYPSIKNLPNIMLNIAEMCYEKAENSEVQKECAKKLQHLSSELLEKYVAGKTGGSTLTTAYYILGLNYDKFGEYTKAVDAFKNAYQTDPKFKYADYCLFAQGYCYEKIVEKGLISEAEGAPLIAVQYNKLLSSYPQSKYAQHAGDWLQSSR
jgi:predicted negative regulator of RcsB-dependent stress response